MASTIPLSSVDCNSSPARGVQKFRSMSKMLRKGLYASESHLPNGSSKPDMLHSPSKCNIPTIPSKSSKSKRHLTSSSSLAGESVTSSSSRMSRYSIPLHMNRKSPRAPLMKLAKNRDFAKIEEILLNDETDFEHFLNPEGKTPRGGPDQNTQTTDETSTSEVINGQGSGSENPDTTILHEILVYRPTFLVVDLLCRILTEERYGLTSAGHTGPEDTTDKDGRKPLHIAAEHGCDIDVIKRLAKGNSYAIPVMAVDSKGRTPLHWACVNPRGYDIQASSKSFGGIRTLKYSKKGVENMVAIVKFLVKSYPRATVLKDTAGQCPLEIARAHKADQRIINLIISTVQRIAKRQKSKCAQSFCDKRMSLNDTPIDLDAEMDKAAAQAKETTTPPDIPLEITVHSDLPIHDDDCSTSSSLGDGGISKHSRPPVFTPFENINTLLDI